MDHFEHYRNLHLQTEVSEIKAIVEKYKDEMHPQDYRNLMMHIRISENLLNMISLSYLLSVNAT